MTRHARDFRVLGPFHFLNDVIISAHLVHEATGAGTVAALEGTMGSFQINSQSSTMEKSFTDSDPTVGEREPEMLTNLVVDGAACAEETASPYPAPVLTTMSASEEESPTVTTVESLPSKRSSHPEVDMSRHVGIVATKETKNLALVNSPANSSSPNSLQSPPRRPSISAAEQIRSMTREKIRSFPATSPSKAKVQKTFSKNSISAGTSGNHQNVPSNTNHQTPSKPSRPYTLNKQSLRKSGTPDTALDSSARKKSSH